MFNGKKVTAIIVAAGRGSRFGADVPKQFVKLGEKTVIEETVGAFRELSEIDELIVVVAEDYIDTAKKLLKDVRLAAGGAERQDSVRKGLELSEGELILIHDGARPYVKKELILNVLETADKSGAAVPCTVPKESIRTKEGNLTRDELYSVQTPQGFKREIILRAYEKAYDDGFYGTDDAGLVDRLGMEVIIVEGDYDNTKITTRSDVIMKTDREVRNGIGFDVHRLVQGRKCTLLGVHIPYELGLLGHSDADVATHALMDAMLGAAALGDIGRHFPDTDMRYKDISSMRLLAMVRDLVKAEGYSIANIDVTIICERPRISPYVKEMCENLSTILGMEKSAINIKATTTEGLGFTGRGEGIASIASCTVSR